MVTVAPAALADTVTPPIFSPAAEATVPLSSASAAGAVVGTAASPAMASHPARIFLMTCLPGCRSPSGRRRNGLQIGDDGVDLRRLELIFEAWHAARAVADDAAHHLVAAARGIPRQGRSV